jgi:hypothetical protein
MTAVEWFFNEIKHILPNDFLVKYEQAKEMEKKIIAQAFEDGDYNYFYSKKTGKDFENGLEYYNEKFKSE